MSKGTVTTVALGLAMAAAVGMAAKSQAPELRRYLKIKRM